MADEQPITVPPKRRPVIGRLIRSLFISSEKDEEIEINYWETHDGKVERNWSSPKYFKYNDAPLKLPGIDTIDELRAFFQPLSDKAKKLGDRISTKFITAVENTKSEQYYRDIHVAFQILLDSEDGIFYTLVVQLKIWYSGAWGSHAYKVKICDQVPLEEIMQRANSAATHLALDIYLKVAAAYDVPPTTFSHQNDV